MASRAQAHARSDDLKVRTVANSHNRAASREPVLDVDGSLRGRPAGRSRPLREGCVLDHLVHVAVVVDRSELAVRR